MSAALDHDLRYSLTTPACLARSRRIFKLSCRFDGQDREIEVGRPLSEGGGVTLAILDDGRFAAFCVHSDDGVESAPAGVSHPVHSVTEFSLSVQDAAADAEIHALVKRLARPHSSGGYVVERAALLASGSDFAAVMAWIADHAGVAEAMASEAPRRGLHGPRLGLSGGTEPRTPLRFVLPAGALA